MTEYKNIITQERVDVYLATNGIFEGLFKEVKELSKKKPDAIMNVSKVRIVNRVLEELKAILESEPEGKFLEVLDDDTLPQTSDAVLIMVQYETALGAFANRYFRRVEEEYGRSSRKWITQDVVEECNRLQEERRSRWTSEDDSEDSD